MKPATPRNQSKSQSSWWTRFKDFSWFILLLIAIELVDRVLFQETLQDYGIRPRQLSHLEGVLFAPFLHANWAHLIGNSVSLLLLGAIILVRGLRELALVSVISSLVAGVFVWLVGGVNTNHIGASSIVFGYLGFLLASGFYQRTFGTILISLGILIFYGGTLMGAFPTETIREANISWEGHLGGAIGGLLSARHLRKKARRRRRTTA